MKNNSVWIVCALLITGMVGCYGGPMAEENRPIAAVDDAVDAAVDTVVDTPPAPQPAAAMVSDAAVGQVVTASCPPNDLYAADGVKSLTDGKMGSEYYYDQEWMGWWYEDKPFEATVDLGKLVAIEELGVHVLTCTESWIFYPRAVEFELSQDGKAYKKVATVKPTEDELEKDYPDTKTLKASNLGEEARYVRVTVERYGELPTWHLGHGGADGYEGEAWLFIDEILVNPK